MNFPKFSNGIEFSLPNAFVDFNTRNSPLDHIFESKSYRFNESNFFRSTVNEGKLIKDNVEVFSGDLAFYVDLSNDVSGLDVDKLFGKVDDSEKIVFRVYATNSIKYTEKIHYLKRRHLII